MPARLGAMPPRLPAPRKLADPFYLSPEWKALKAKRRRDPDHAAALARCNPGEWVVLDHKRERRDGGADLDPANTEWLTHGEHQAKTARARAARAGFAGRATRGPDRGWVKVWEAGGSGTTPPILWRFFLGSGI
jgi:hypothetical protein